MINITYGLMFLLVFVSSQDAKRIELRL
jgi:hypothetical protein